MKLISALLLGLLLVIPAHAGVMNIRLIDPAHTDAGEAIERWLAAIPDARITRQDITELRRSQPPVDGVVVWLSPDPALYAPDARQIWNTILANPSISVFTIGVPTDPNERNTLLASLRQRIDIAAGADIGIHLKGANWIWTPEPPKDHQTIRLRKTFDLDVMPKRAWINLAVDNRAIVFINGHRAGQAESWHSPADFDVRAFLQPGQNVIAIEAYNDDGPAGVIASLLAETNENANATAEAPRRGEGRGDSLDHNNSPRLSPHVRDSAVASIPTPKLARIITDATWKFSVALDDANWSSPGFDDHAWRKAKIIAKFGGGEWGTSIDTNYQSDLRPLQVTADHAIGRNDKREIGQACVPLGLSIGPEAASLLQAGGYSTAASSDVAAGRSIVATTDLDSGSANILNSPLFAKFICRSVLWLSRRPIDTAITTVAVATSRPAATTLDRATFFPVTMQLSPIPYEGVPPTRNLPTSASALHRMIDNYIAHGVTLLQVPLPLPESLARDVEAYAKSRGMGLTYYFEKSQTGFKRDKPAIPLRSETYRDQLAARIDQALKPLADESNIYNVFAMQDEPFHAGVESFTFSKDDQAAFQKQFGYAMPSDPKAARQNPRQWLDLLNFESDSFPTAWRAMYRDMKKINPSAEFVMNHDSHNVFGGAAGQEGQIFVDDVFHWGGDFADVLSFDIYPYLMKDFRYGPNRTLKLPRMAQTHYALAQMRDVTTQYGKKLGFFFGTYNPEWFDLTREGREQFWQSREMIDTAVAGSADELIAGLNAPIDYRHWDDLGDALRTLQKAAPEMLKTHPPRAAAAMLFPRTQCIQLQQEYWNVGESFELFQRAFGELDMLHEEQIDQLANYRVLVLFDVTLLPDKVVHRIRQFVDAGGIVIADCVPNLDALRRPSDGMTKLFGVRNAKTDRILWPAKMKAEIETDPAHPATMPAATQPSDAVTGNALGVEVDFPIVSPRPCETAGANVLLQTRGHAPAILTRNIGKGRVYLLGFCVQDTAFEAWRTGRLTTIKQIGQLFESMTHDVPPHVRSTNLAVEAAVRTGANQAFIFIISHEAGDGHAHVQVGNLPFTPSRLSDVATGQPVEFTRASSGIEFDVNAPNGFSEVLRLLP